MGDRLTAEVTCVLDARAELGECPVWSASEQALYWVDIRAPAMHRLDPVTGATKTWPMPTKLTASTSPVTAVSTKTSHTRWCARLPRVAGSMAGSTNTEGTDDWRSA